MIFLAALLMDGVGALRCAKVVVSSVDGGAVQVDAKRAPVRSVPRGRARVAPRAAGGKQVVGLGIKVLPNHAASVGRGSRLRRGGGADATALARFDLITVVVRE